LARQKGASVVRAHDVAQTVDALRVLEAVLA
jgi:dihydropteroate synthase